VRGFRFSARWERVARLGSEVRSDGRRGSVPVGPAGLLGAAQLAATAEHGRVIVWTPLPEAGGVPGGERDWAPTGLATAAPDQAAGVAGDCDGGDLPADRGRRGPAQAPASPEAAQARGLPDRRCPEPPNGRNPFVLTDRSGSFSRKEGRIDWVRTRRLTGSLLIPTMSRSFAFPSSAAPGAFPQEEPHGQEDK